MTTPALIRVHERRLGSGAVEVSIVCPCTRVGRVRAPWEDRAAAIAELMGEHQARAVICPHRRSWDRAQADRARVAAGGGSRR
jgi:hypothetical protein